MAEQSGTEVDDSTISGMSEAFGKVLELAIPNSDREKQAQGLEKTPVRAAKAFSFFTKGYRDDLTSEHEKVYKLCTSMDPLIDIPGLFANSIDQWSCVRR